MISLRSEITKKTLRYFYLHSQEEVYINELVRKLRVDKRNLVKKLHELEDEGLLQCKMIGNLKLYSIDRGYSLYKEYEKIIRKTAGLETEIESIIRSVKGVKEAYIFGSYAQGKLDKHSDIDLLVVGDHSALILQRKLYQLAKEIDREINVVDMGLSEYQKKLKNKDPFLKGVLNNKYIKVK